MFATITPQARRLAVFVAVTVVAVVIESIQRESIGTILISAWLPALVLAALWTRGGWPRWLRAAA